MLWVQPLRGRCLSLPQLLQVGCGSRGLLQQLAPLMSLALLLQPACLYRCHAAALSEQRRWHSGWCT